jgi:hypothetical protein
LYPSPRSRLPEQWIDFQRSVRMKASSFSKYSRKRRRRQFNQIVGNAVAHLSRPTRYQRYMQRLLGAAVFFEPLVAAHVAADIPHRGVAGGHGATLLLFEEVAED